MNQWLFKVLYDDDCPYCRVEYKFLERCNKKGQLAFEDISSDVFDASQYGLTQDEVIAHIHGVYPDGRTITGVAVFREAYRQVGLGWLLAPTGWPILRPCFDIMYKLFASYRVPMGRFVGRNCHGSCDIKR